MKGEGPSHYRPCEAKRPSSSPCVIGGIPQGLIKRMPDKSSGDRSTFICRGAAQSFHALRALRRREPKIAVSKVTVSLTVASAKQSTTASASSSIPQTHDDGDSGVKSTQFLHLIKSINAAIETYSVTSKSLVFNMYLSKSREISVSKCT